MANFSENKKIRQIFPLAHIVACLLCLSLLVAGICCGMPEVQAADMDIVYMGELAEGVLSSADLNPRTLKVAQFKFKAPETAEYEFYSIADAETETFRSNSVNAESFSIFKYGTTDSGGNSSLRVNMAKGITYYFNVQYKQLSSKSGTVYVGVRKPLSAEDFEEDAPLTGITDGIRQTLDVSNQTALISFCPQESGYYSIFSQDCCQGKVSCSQTECPQDCTCREQGECTCLNDLWVECLTKKEGGSLTAYCFGQSGEAGGFLIYRHFEAGTTYFFKVSPKSGLAEGSFLFSIGKDFNGTALPSAVIGTDMNGSVKNYDLFYSFQPSKTATYHFQSEGGIQLYMVLYDSHLNEVKIGEESRSGNDFDIKQKLEQGKTYYLKISTLYSQLLNFKFRIDIVEDPDTSSGDNNSSGDSSGGNSSSGNGDNSSGSGNGNGNGDSGSGNGGGNGSIILPGDNGNGGSNNNSGGSGNGGSGNGGGTTINKKKSITSVTLKAIGSKAYTGKSLKPSVTLKDGNTTLKNGTDYTVSYSNNKKIGTAKVTIKGIGNYEGTRTASFKIVPNKTKITKAKRKGKNLTLQWKKVKGATGYEIKYSTSSNFKKAKTKTTKKCKFTLKLPNKKKWYVRIRAYKVVGKKKVYGSYSKAKKS